MFLEYLPDKTFIHSLDIRTKIGCFIGLIIISFLFTSPFFNLFLFLAVLSMAYYIKLPMKKIYPLCIALIPVGLMIILITGFTYLTSQFYLGENKTVLIYLFPGNSLGISMGGIKMGFTFVIRLFTMVIASTILTLSTPVEDFVRLSNKLKLPPEIAFIITTAIGFIPTMDKKRQLIIEAQQTRGAQLYKKGLITRIKGYLPILIPLFTNSIVISNTLAMSMLNRGYGSSNPKNYSSDLSFQTIDYIIMFVFIIIIILSFYLRFVLKYGIL